MKFLNLSLALALVATSGFVSAATIRRAGASGNVIAFADSCSVLSCIETLAGSVSSCYTAYEDDGLNPIADAKCFADAVKAVINVPSECGDCF